MCVCVCVCVCVSVGVCYCPDLKQYNGSRPTATVAIAIYRVWCHVVPCLQVPTSTTNGQWMMNESPQHISPEPYQQVSELVV